MKTFHERAKRLRPRDAWFGCTYEEAPIRAMREAQSLSGGEKLEWLEQMSLLMDSLSEARKEKRTIKKTLRDPTG